MKKSARYLVDGLGVVAILGFFICLLGLILILIKHPAVFASTKRVLTFVVEIAGSGTLIAYVAGRARRYVAEAGSLGAGLVVLLRREPLIHSMLWIFIVAEVLTLTYMLPIHFAVIELTAPPGCELAAPADRVEIVKGGRPYLLTRTSPEGNTFRSPRILSWKDDCYVRIVSDRSERDSVFVPWQAFAFLDAIHGVKPPRIILRPVEPESVTVTVGSVMPAFADVKLVSGELEATFHAPEIFRVKKNSTVRITISAGSTYGTEETSFIAHCDTTLALELDLTPGRVVFRAENEGRVEVPNMVIYVDSRKLEGKLSGHPILLSSGSHEIRLEKDLGDGTWAVVEPFQFTIGPGAVRECTLTVTLTRR